MTTILKAIWGTIAGLCVTAILVSNVIHIVGNIGNDASFAMRLANVAVLNVFLFLGAMLILAISSPCLIFALKYEKEERENQATNVSPSPSNDTSIFK